MNNPAIETGLAIPPRSKWGGILDNMGVGDSVVITISESAAMRSQARMKGMDVVARTIEPNRVRVWRTK